MLKVRLSNEQRELLLELLNLMSEADGKVTFDEMKYIYQIIETFDGEDNNRLYLTKEDIYTELEQLKPRTRTAILAHAILLGLEDGDFSKKEEELISYFYDLLSNEDLKRIQSLISEHSTLNVDVESMFNVEEVQIEAKQEVTEDESLQLMNKYSKHSVNDIDTNKLMKMKKGPIKKVWDEVIQLWQIVRNPKNSTAVKAIGVGALIYLISPLDAIPDVIPFAGLTDDVGVIAYAIAQVNKMNRNF